MSSILIITISVMIGAIVSAVIFSGVKDKVDDLEYRCHEIGKENRNLKHAIECLGKSLNREVKFYSMIPPSVFVDRFEKENVNQNDFYLLLDYLKLDISSEKTERKVVLKGKK